MKKKIVLSIVFVVVAAASYFVGTTQAHSTITEKEVIREVKAAPNDYISTTSEEFKNNYVDMRQVKDFVVNGGNLQLYFDNGNGYYWER